MRARADFMPLNLPQKNGPAPGTWGGELGEQGRLVQMQLSQWTNELLGLN